MYIISNVSERSRVGLMVSLAMSLAGAAVVHEAAACHVDLHLLRSPCESVLWNASSWCVRVCEWIVERQIVKPYKALFT